MPTVSSHDQDGRRVTICYQQRGRQSSRNLIYTLNEMGETKSGFDKRRSLLPTTPYRRFAARHNALLHQPDRREQLHGQLSRCRAEITSAGTQEVRQIRSASKEVKARCLIRSHISFSRLRSSLVARCWRDDLQPNIVHIMVDDPSWQDVAYYYATSTTKNLSTKRRIWIASQQHEAFASCRPTRRL